MKRLHSLSYKTLFAILFFSLAGIVFFLKIGGKTTKVSAAWWDDNWHYRQAINISSHTSTESNVYITTSINISSTDKAQTDDGDFRFISQSGENLSYYIISGAGTTNVSFHIQLNYFPAGAQTIFAYYGNSITTNGFSLSDFSTTASNYTIGSISIEESGGGPIAYWKFDETTGTTAYDSSGTNNGTITNATSTTEDQCISGKCLYFNGTASVVIPNNPSLQITGNQTISMWVKPTAIGTRCNPFNKAYGGEGTITLETNGTLTYYWGTAGANGTPYQGFSSNALSSNNWNYVSLVRDITNNKLTWYINGKVNSSGTPSYSQATASTANLILGSGYAGSFTGYIDEVKIYPYARTADQVKQDYNSRGTLSGAGVNLGVKSNTAPSLKSSLVGYWKFDEGQSSSVNNSINGGPNFTLGNGSSSPSWTNEAKSNKSLSFINSSNQYAVSVFDSGILKSTNETGSFTLSAWVKPGTQNGNERIILGRSGCHGGLVATNSNQFGFNIAATDCWTSGLILSSGVIPNWTNWHHVVGVYNNKSVKIYVDGILKNSGTLSGTMSNYGDGMFIGAIGSYAFNGLIDEVKIYNKALTADEIKQDYNANSAIQFGSTNQTIGGTTTSLDYCIPGDTSYCVPPVAEYNFEENTGTTAKDTSGGNNNGNFSSGSYAPTWSTGKNNTGSGIKFNGESNSSYINTSFPSTPPSSYTAEAWIKPFSISSSLNPSFGYSILAASYDSTHYPLWITLRDGEITATSFSNAITPVSTSGANIQTNRWYHIAVSAVQNGPAIIYVNGIGKTSFTSSNIAWNSNDKLTIGELRPTRNISFNGIIDQVKIYDYARTPAQVAYDYNRGNPIAWWKLDECQGSITNDSSGVGNTGVIFIGSSGTQNSIGTCQIGTSAAWTNGSSGHSNGSLNFDGIDDYVDMGTTIGNNYSNISVSAWIYPTSTNTGTIIAKNGPFYLGWTSQKARGSIYNGTSWVSTTGNTTLSLNQWHHLLMTYNGTNINVYVDGKYDGTNTTSGSLAVTSAHVQIGGNTAAGFNQYFSGQIDDVRIYNYTLTQEQVKQIYNGGSVNFQ